MEAIIHGLKAAVQILDVTNKTAEKAGKAVRADASWQNLPMDRYAAVAGREIEVEAQNAPPPASREKAVLYSQKAGRFSTVRPEDKPQESGRHINLRA